MRSQKELLEFCSIIFFIGLLDISIVSFSFAFTKVEKKHLFRNLPFLNLPKIYWFVPSTDTNNIRAP